MKSRYVRRQIVAVSIVGFIIIVIIIGLAILLVNKTDFNDNPPNNDEYNRYDDNRLYYNSQWYLPKDNIDTILFIGIDRFGEIESTDSSQQADFIVLAVIDHNSESIQFLQFNRDTLTEIYQTDIYGQDAGSIFAQLALSHTYGDTESLRCRNTVKAIENLLYGQNIAHYMSFTMDAVSHLNDAVGGVTITLTQDLTELAPSYTAGSEITLIGDAALDYVRARGGLEDNSNLARMERQREYMEGLLKSCSRLASQNTELPSDIVTDIAPYFFTDLTAHQLSRLYEKIGQYQISSILTLAGESVKGETYMEYHLDENAVRDMVIQLFYTLPDEETEA